MPLPLWLGIASLASSVLGTAASIWSQNRNINKSLEAQQDENDKAFDKNKELADIQNTYNVQQWARENAYNSPSAQKGRLLAAGLNPDMMYGGSGVQHTAASASMSSGSPYEPVDWSSLANKRTVGDAVMESLAIEQARANIRKTNAEANISSADADVRARMNSLGLSKLEIDTDLAAELSNLYNAQSTSVDLSNDEAMWRKELRDKFGNEYVENKVKQMAAAAKISESQMQYEVETLVQRIVGTNAENTPLVNISNLSNQNVRLLIDVLKFLFK